MTIHHFGRDFIIRRVSNEGTRNPIVARLTIQSFELIDFWKVDKEQKDQVKAACLDLSNRLLRCEELINNLRQKVESARQESDELNAQNGGRIVSIPHIVNLDRDVESFLYEAKNYLRELLKIINQMFGTSFSNASSFFRGNREDVETILAWAAREHGEEDELTKMLSEDQDWISELIQKRNAAEHPGGYSGTLHIENIRYEQGNLIAPTWHRDNNEPSPIFADLIGILDNLLTFTEDIIVNGIKKNPISGGILFAQIPQEERNPDCPIRIKIGLNLPDSPNA